MEETPMADINMDRMISEIVQTLASDQDAEADQVLDAVSRKWASDPLAIKIVRGLRKNPSEFSPLFEDLLREKLPRDKALADDLGRIVSAGNADISNDSGSSELSREEIDVLKALEQIGGGNPVDIAVEGMLDIDQTRKTAERLWRKGLLLSHPLKDPDAKRFFSFSDLNRDVYKKLMETSHAKLASES